VQGDVVRFDIHASKADVHLLQPSIVTEEAPKNQNTQNRIDNVVLVLIDTVRADKLHPINPRTHVRTPGLNAYVSNVVVLDNARSQENWTKPSVATLLSSLMPWEHNTVTGDAVLPRSVQILPELLRKKGFHTGAFIANGYVSDKFGFKQGWSTYRNYIREGRRTPAQYVAADVLKWLENRPQDKPFFLYVHTIDPHVPYKPPRKFLEMYDDRPYGGVVDFRRTASLLEKIKVGSLRLKTRDKERLEALYDAEITYHDIHLASILQELDRQGLADNTMVVITSDHGEEFWDHGSVGHGHSVFDELLHVPLIIRIPGLTKNGTHITDAVGLVDVMPTILDALGYPIPEELAGHSLMPLIRDEDRGAPRISVAGFMQGWRTLNVGRYKLIHRTASQMTLYDLNSDPDEKHDIAEQQPVTLRYLRGLLGLALESTSNTAQDKQRKPTSHTRQKTFIDPKTKAQLRALGYVN